MYFQIFTLSRILQVYVLQLGMGLFYLIIAYFVLKRSRKRLNQIFSSYFIITFIGILVNVIYAPITDIPTVTMLAYLTVYLIYFAQIFLLVFNLILLKSTKIINTKIQLIIIIGYAVLLSFAFLIPNGLTISESNNYIPYWNLPYFLFHLIISLSFAVIPSIYTSIKVYTKIEDIEVKTRWKYYFFGITTYFIAYLGISVCNYINNPTIRLIWNSFALIMFVCAYFMYYGVLRQLKQEE
ncbi:MAG: hypothetical protein ACFFAO_00595 [Candidatus Hermodarchaeota archaeon]